MFTVNGRVIEVTQFPDQTSQVWKLSPSIFQAGSFDVRWRFASEADFMQLAQLKMLLDTYNKSCRLEIAYLPYGRQDKEVSNETTFALRAFAKQLNALNFDEVVIIDPHSSVALEEIKKSRASYPVELVSKLIGQTKCDLICYPDKGARTRYSEIYAFPSIFGEKIRDQQTGAITSYKVVGDAKAKRILIVDDICDGGATFISLAKDLLAAGASEVNLFVTHGLFSKGLRELRRAGINRIFALEGEASESQHQIAYKGI